MDRRPNFDLTLVSSKSLAFSLKETNPHALLYRQAAIAQLGERQTEDLKVPGSIPGLGNLVCLHFAMVADI